jgi:hypothetical protein
MRAMWSRAAQALTLAMLAVGATSTLAGAGCHHSRAGAPARAQGPDGISIVRAPTGLLIVVNHHPVHLTLSLAGEELGVSEDDPAVWLVDGQIIQVAVVPRQAIYGEDASKVSDQQLLLDHLSWESRYVSEQLGTDVRARPQACRTARGASCLFFDYDVPGEGDVLAGGRRNIYLTTVVADQVVGLSSPVRPGEDPGLAEARLRAVLETFMPREGWIDPKAEEARLRTSAH